MNHPATDRQSPLGSFLGQPAPSLCDRGVEASHLGIGVQVIESQAGCGRAQNCVYRSGMSAAGARDVNRRAGLALRQPAVDPVLS
jgi:hypothetical protein